MPENDELQREGGGPIFPRGWPAYCVRPLNNPAEEMTTVLVFADVKTGPATCSACDGKFWRACVIHFPHPGMSGACTNMCKRKSLLCEGCYRELLVAKAREIVPGESNAPAFVFHMHVEDPCLN